MRPFLVATFPAATVLCLVSGLLHCSSSSSSSSGGVMDGGSDGATANGPVTCSWQSATPVTLADLSSARAPTFGGLLYGHVSADGSIVRVAASYTGDLGATQLFTVHVKEGKSSALEVAAPLLDAQSTSQGLTLLGASPTGALELRHVADAPADPTAPAPLTISGPIAPLGPKLEAKLTETTPGHFFFVASAPASGDSGGYDFVGGSADTAPRTQGLFDTNEHGNVGPMFAFPTNDGNLWVAVGNDPTNPTRLYKLPALAAPTKTAPISTTGSNGGSLLAAGVSKSDPTKIDVMAGTVSTASGIELTIFSGQTTIDQLASITVTPPTFTKAGTFGGADVPANSGNTEFLGDGWAAVGIGVTPISGLNLAWVDAKGTTVVRQTGADRLLLGKNVTAGMIKLLKQDAANAATFAVAWKETVDAHDVLYFNSLTCAPSP